MLPEFNFANSKLAWAVLLRWLEGCCLSLMHSLDTLLVVRNLHIRMQRSMIRVILFQTSVLAQVQLRTPVSQAILRAAHMRHVLGSAFDAWMQRVEGKRHLAAMCARITAWHAHRKLRTLFAAWAGLTQQEHFARLHDEVILHTLGASLIEALEIEVGELSAYAWHWFSGPSDLICLSNC